jgi:hypothetical protein
MQLDLHHRSVRAIPDLAVSIAVRIHKGAREVVDLLLAVNPLTARVPPRAQWPGEYLVVHRSPPWLPEGPWELSGRDSGNGLSSV